MCVMGGMRIGLKTQVSLELAAKLRKAQAATPELMAEVLNVSQRRALVPGHSEIALHLEQLIAARAWIDVALVLLELELPLWHIRRIAYDDGEWHCALSRQRELPDWLDESHEASHPDLALAILSAFIEAQAAAASSVTSSIPEPFARPDSEFIRLCCDNFA